MSKDWTPEELQTASRAMKEAGHMGYEEFCEAMDRGELKTAADDELHVYPIAGNVDPRTVKLPDIEGLKELWDAIQDQNRYLALRKEYDRGFITKRPTKPTSNVALLKEQYPRAAAYLAAMEWAGSSKFKKAAFGKQAMERIFAGEDSGQVLDDMQRAWAAFRVAQEV